MAWEVGRILAIPSSEAVSNVQLAGEGRSLLCTCGAISSVIGSCMMQELFHEIIDVTRRALGFRPGGDHQEVSGNPITVDLFFYSR